MKPILGIIFVVTPYIANDLPLFRPVLLQAYNHDNYKFLDLAFRAQNTFLPSYRQSSILSTYQLRIVSSIFIRKAVDKIRPPYFTKVLKKLSSMVSKCTGIGCSEVGCSKYRRKSYRDLRHYEHKILPQISLHIMIASQSIHVQAPYRQSRISRQTISNK